MRLSLAFDLEAYLHDRLEGLDLILRDSSSQGSYFEPIHSANCLRCFRYRFFDRVRETLWRLAHNFDTLPDQTRHLLGHDIYCETITLCVKMVSKLECPLQ
jgi:hypothetical protein